ncbi:glycoside hydrolase family 38 N-terminal domain-containing protein [Solitalea koreensis]|uniref:Glycosyl hydrolases family 38 C-terminal domain-containing protein n=1 Tax=Solitalea koreensis TaxID=543615 RepID=A0A521DK57_9SPHI|nr:hypothetical protein [Solitalea koreensis]SMO72123.1 Glycosyl hydrolases family 38 C-terminal domain-containing protein [Solitalea koreensis]
MKILKMNYVITTVASSLLVCTSLMLRAQEYDPLNTLPGSSPLAANAGAQHEVKPAALKQVIIVYKTHFDIGYSETVQQVVHDYRTAMADKVLDAIEKNKDQPNDKQFVWTVSGWPMKQILWEGQLPDRKRKIEEAIKKGNLTVHAFPFSMHVETSEPEDLVRGLNISSTLARKYHLPLPISAKMSDVPGQSWIIPTLLTRAGIKFYHMGGPVVNKTFGLPPFFWWEGPDGSRLLTLYNNGYGSSPLPPANWPFKTWVYVSMTGDNQGPPSPETVAKDIAFYQKMGIKATVGALDDFAHLVMKEDLSKLPVVRSDIGDPWIHGTMAIPEASKLATHIRPSIAGLDELANLEKLWGIYNPDISSKVADAYENSLLYSEHTWGLANQHYVKLPYGKPWQEQWGKGLPPQYSLLEKSWADHAGYIEKVQQLVDNPYKDAVATLADNVKIDGNRIMVYNPLPWKRGGEIQFDSRLLFGNEYVSLKPADGGEPIAVSHELGAIEDKQPFSRFFVPDIPSMGYRTFIASKEVAKKPLLSFNKQEGVMESPFFKAILDAKKGRIVSLVDKRSGRELVDSEAPQGFGQYFHERFGYAQLDEWLQRSLYPQYKAHRFAFVAYDMPQDGTYSTSQPENMTLDFQLSEIDVKAVLTCTLYNAGAPQQISISLSLSGYEPVADVALSWQKQPDSWPEAAWLCLPFKVANPVFQLGRLGGVANPATDMNIENANHHLWWVNNGAAVYDSLSGSGVGFYSPDAPLLSVGAPGEYKFDSHFAPCKSWIYLNLYNNHWRTNFPAWIGNGQRMSASVRLWSFEKFNTESSLITPAMETRIPLQAAGSKLQKGQLPTTQSGIQLSEKGIAVTAFGPNPDGNGIILRLWEQTGKSGTVEVRLPASGGFSNAQPVNLRGEPFGNKIPITNGKLQVTIPAYAPISLVLNR